MRAATIIFTCFICSISTIAIPSSDRVQQLTRESIGIDIDTPSCDACLFGLKGIKFISHLPEVLFIGALKAGCKMSDIFNHDVVRFSCYTLYQVTHTTK